MVYPETDGSEATVFAQICHIYGVSDDGPRAVAGMSAEKRNAPENLILLCGNHHTLVDKRPEAFPAEQLKTWKRKQEHPDLALLDDYLAYLESRLSRLLSEATVLPPRPGAEPAEVAIARRGEGQKARAAVREDILRMLPPGVSVIVGESGSGKSTLLRRLALSAVSHELAPPDRRHIPALADCARYSGSFRRLVNDAALDMTGVPLDITTAPQTGEPIIVFCDDYQSCADKRALLEQAREWTAASNDLRVVLFSHDGPAIDTLVAARIPVFDLEELPDQELQKVFSGFIEAEEAEALYEALAIRGNLGSFRTPLLASFVAAAHIEDQTGAGLGLRRGQLLRRVIANGLLGSWASQRSPRLTNTLSEPTVEILGRLAAALLRRDRRSLPLKAIPPSASVAPLQAPGPSIRVALAAGLLRRHQDRFGFAHDALRDYFAAEYLLRAPPREVAFAWLSRNWRGALGYFASLWPGDRRRTSWLRLCTWLSFRVLRALRRRPDRRATELFYFMLDFAAEGGSACGWLQQRLLDRFTQGSTYLDSEVEVSNRTFLSPAEGKLAHVFRLFGRMNDEKIQGWLNTSKGRRRYRVHGIRQENSLASVTALLSSVGSDDDILADDTAMELAFEHPHRLLKEAFQDVLASHDQPASLLRCLGRAQGWRGGQDRIGRTLRSDPFWRDLLVEQVLHADDEVSSAALSVVSSLSIDHLLEKNVEARFVESLESAEPLCRSRAAWGLYLSRSDSSLEALRQTLDRDPDSRVCLSAIDALILRDGGTAPKYFLTWLRRWGTMDRSKFELCQPSVATFVRTWSSGERSRLPHKKFARWFALMAYASDDPIDRMVAINGLSRLRGEAIAELLDELLERETYLSVQRVIAEKYGLHPETDYQSMVKRLSTHPDPQIRSQLAKIVWQRSEDVPANVLAKMRDVCELDTEPGVRADFERHLRMIESRGP